MSASLGRGWSFWLYYQNSTLHINGGTPPHVRSSEAPSHRLQTSLTRATVEDSTAGLGSTTPTLTGSLIYIAFTKESFFKLTTGQTNAWNAVRWESGTTFWSTTSQSWDLKTAAINVVQFKKEIFLCAAVREGEDELALRERKASTLRSFTNTANVGEPNRLGTTARGRGLTSHLSKQLSKVSMGSGWENMYHEHVDRNLSEPVCARHTETASGPLGSLG